MIYAFTVTNQKRPTWLMLKHSIRRNFGGMEEEDIDPLNIFERRLNSVTKIEQVFDFKSFDFKALFTEC